MAFATWEIAIIAILFLLFFIIAGVAAFIIINRYKWNFRYVVFEKSDGQEYHITKKGRCRLIPFGDGGEEIFILKGNNKYRVAYGKRIGKNQIAWAVGQDGYWYNVSFGDLDKRLSELGVNPIDRDMRYAYASARKGIENRYNKKDFLEKYGMFIAFGMLFFCILAMGGFLWVSFSQEAKVASINADNIKASKDVMDSAKTVMDSAANIMSQINAVKSGSGFIQGAK